MHTVDTEYVIKPVGAKQLTRRMGGTRLNFVFNFSRSSRVSKNTPLLLKLGCQVPGVIFCVIVSNNAEQRKFV